MEKIRRPLVFIIVGFVVGALLLGDMLSAFAQSPEVAATAVPAIASSVPAVAPIIVAQREQRPPRRRRTLMDLLFGDDQQQQQQEQAPVVDEPAVVRPSTQAAAPPAKPKVEKAEGATRLAVFGDSMSIDLAKALERLYAEDPNLVIISHGAGDSSFVRPDFFDCNKTITE